MAEQTGSESMNEGLKKHPSHMRKSEVMLELAILKKDDPDICQWPKKWGDLTESLAEMRTRLLKHWKKQKIKYGEPLSDWKDRPFGPSTPDLATASSTSKPKKKVIKHLDVKAKPKVWRKDYTKSEVILIRHLLKWVPAKILQVDTDGSSVILLETSKSVYKGLHFRVPWENMRKTKETLRAQKSAEAAAAAKKKAKKATEVKKNSSMGSSSSKVGSKKPRFGGKTKVTSMSGKTKPSFAESGKTKPTSGGKTMA